MSIQLSKLLPEMLWRKFPSRTEQPDRRKKAAEVVKFIRAYADIPSISRWEFSRAGTVILYFGAIHHDPKMTRQTLPRLIQVAEKFDFPFQLFADGNLIAMEILKEL